MNNKNLLPVSAGLVILFLALIVIGYLLFNSRPRKIPPDNIPVVTETIEDFEATGRTDEWVNYNDAKG